MSGNFCLVNNDQAFSVVTLADVTDLTFPIKPNTLYIADFTIYFSTAISTTGIYLSINGPASPTFLRWGKIVPTAPTTTRTEVAATYNGGTPETSSGSVPLMARLFCTLINGPNAGSLVIRAASEVAASAVTILKGSYGVLRP